MEIVSTHHRKSVENCYRNCPIDKIPLVAEGIIRDLKFVKDRYGNSAYPGLENRDNFECMIVGEITLAEAVLSGHFEEIPDRGNNGRVNIDSFCRCCVNYRPNTNTCDFEERYLRWCFENRELPYK